MYKQSNPYSLWKTECPEIYKVEYIDIGLIHPHPDSPRRMLGDLTGLTESIRENGVLQCLTVVPWFSPVTYLPSADAKNQRQMGYVVVIGRRRLEAARIAGLLKVPCIVSEMSLRQQVRVMLMENLHRQELTYFEQAGALHLLTELGEPLTEAAVRCGLSYLSAVGIFEHAGYAGANVQ